MYFKEISFGLYKTINRKKKVKNCNLEKQSNIIICKLKKKIRKRLLVVN
jgi:hypothetical protein